MNNWPDSVNNWADSVNNWPDSVNIWHDSVNIWHDSVNIWHDSGAGSGGARGAPSGAAPEERERFWPSRQRTGDDPH